MSEHLTVREDGLGDRVHADLIAENDHLSPSCLRRMEIETRVHRAWVHALIRRGNANKKWRTLKGKK